MYYPDFFIVFVAAMLAGVLNAIIGGGWFVLFPGLVATGLQPVNGNAITATALWSGHVATLKRTDGNISITQNSRRWILVISIVGGVSGALLLVLLTHEIFETIGPYLLLFSWLLYTFYDAILRFVMRIADLGNFEYSHGKFLPFLLVSIYGSYFGAGLGLIITAMLRGYGLNNPDEVEKIKNHFVLANNGSAIAVFICSGIMSWPTVAISIAGVISGGYISQLIDYKYNIRIIKKIIVIAGAIVTLYFLSSPFVESYF